MQQAIAPGVYVDRGPQRPYTPKQTLGGVPVVAVQEPSSYEQRRVSTKRWNDKRRRVTT